MTKQQVLDKIEELTKNKKVKGKQVKVTVLDLNKHLKINRQSINRILYMKKSRRDVYGLKMSTHKVKIIKIRSIDKKPIETKVTQRYFWIE